MSDVQTERPLYVCEIVVQDPETMGGVPLSVYKTSGGGMVALDTSYLEQVRDIVPSPFDDGVRLDLQEEGADSSLSSPEGECRATKSASGLQEVAKLAAEYVLRLELRQLRLDTLRHSRDWPKQRLIDRARELGLLDDPDTPSPAGGDERTYAIMIVDKELPTDELAFHLRSYGINPLHLPSFSTVRQAFK